MFKINKNEEGFTFVIVLLVILVVGALVASFFNSSIFNTRFSSIESDRSRAYFAAQSGIEHLKTFNMSDLFKTINDGEDFSISTQALSYDGGNGSYEVNLDSDSTEDTKIFISNGKFNNSTKDLYLVVDDVGLKNFGAFTSRLLSLQGSADIDGDIYVEMTDDETEGFDKYLVGSGNEIVTSDDGFVFNYDYNENVEEFTLETILGEFLEYDEDDIANEVTNITNNYSKTVADSPVEVNDGDFLYFNDITMNGNKSLEIRRTDYDPDNPPTVPLETIDINIFVEEGFDIGGNSKFSVSEYINVNLWVINCIIKCTR